MKDQDNLIATTLLPSVNLLVGIRVQRPRRSRRPVRVGPFAKGAFDFRSDVPIGGWRTGHRSMTARLGQAL